MEIDELKVLWFKAITELLRSELDDRKLTTLAQQTYDSIRRIEIYKAYNTKAIKAAKESFPFSYTSTPFVLAQRPDLDIRTRVWVLYLATYFGKSNKSKWTLFNRACFDSNNSLITFNKVKGDLDGYFKYLSTFDFFEGCNYSNHRKFTAKKLLGDKGLFRSMEYMVNNINLYSNKDELEFHEMYLLSKRIPNFGRLGGFDFSSSLVKCGFNVQEPKSMYINDSTGPLKALGLILKLTNKKVSVQSQLDLSDKLVNWFFKNSDIFMIGQVLEDAVCNWQKDPVNYIRYNG